MSLEVIVTVIIVVCGISAALVTIYQKLRRKSETIPPTKPAVQTSQQEKPLEADKWELINILGAIRMVYIPPDSIKDKCLIAQVLQNLVNKKETIQVMFFDDKEHTPSGFPMTDEQTLHWRAKYNFNPNTEFERFVYIKITDANTSPPATKEVEANIRPGYCE